MLAEVKICDSREHLICQAPGISFMCNMFFFMRKDCPRLCRQCIDATTVTTTQSITTNITVTPTVKQLDSTVTASTFSIETTSAIIDNTISTKAATEQSKVVVTRIFFIRRFFNRPTITKSILKFSPHRIERTLLWKVSPI
uniref:ShKT domain-containing protein n=1 Tax=Ascaris lumbricoides TaxID=6252 RepID=A0A0M3HEV8_ASCLU